MAITVKLYSFAKRENSTKQPVGSGTDFSCVLLDDTSLMNPVFKLSIATNPIGNNYAYVSDFNRYYFINDISSYQGFWYISCSCDVLASFKTGIGAETHYVLRSASSWDTYLTDTMYPAKPNEAGGFNNQSGSDPMSWATAHSFILGVISQTPASSVSETQIGSVVYYHMDFSTLYTYLSFLMDPTQTHSWSNINTSEYSDAVQQALLNPIQYIVSCQAVPVPPPGSLVINKIMFGYYTVTIDSGKLDVLELDTTVTHSAFLKNESFTVTLPKHPQAATRGKYLNGDPYSTYTLHFGPFGDIPLDPGALIDCTTVSGLVKMDLISGVGRLMVFGTENPDVILYNGTAQISVQLNLTQLSNNMMSSSNKYWSEMMNTMSAVASTNPIAGVMKAIEGGMAMTETAASHRFPTVSGMGATGSFLPFFDDENIYITAKFIELVDENLAEFGRPLYQPKQINTLSGYILCQNADCQLGCTADEAVKINGYLNGGFFYE